MSNLDSTTLDIHRDIVRGLGIINVARQALFADGVCPDELSEVLHAGMRTVQDAADRLDALVADD